MFLVEVSFSDPVVEDSFFGVWDIWFRLFLVLGRHFDIICDKDFVILFTGIFFAIHSDAEHEPLGYIGFGVGVLVKGFPDGFVADGEFFVICEVSEGFSFFPDEVVVLGAESGGEFFGVEDIV